MRFPANIETINLARDGVVENEDADFAAVYVFALIFLLGVFMTNGYLMQSVIEEKESHLIEIMISSIRPTQLLVGKVLAMGLMGIIQIISWVASVLILVSLAAQMSAFVGTFLPAVQIPTDLLPVMLLYFILGYLFFAAGYAAIGALSTSLREGPQYAVIFALPAGLPFYFFSIFAESPDGTLPVILSIFPLTSPLSMIMRLNVSSVPVEQLILSLGLLALSTVGMAWFAGRLFRFQTLLAGQMPKLRDIPKLVRG